ncbi:hypothetical protein J2S20_000963 [Moryella indoligenes]|uniref:Uncharacterized protein n=1 Tax=Moryella indoligenes TaxID=371674 RepID=A0AAE3V9Q7_9FIRM|nr:hypothetical protein [Moryella indoligenes]MDQ0152278.1 hypothetical protein [Moryella indoligenes]
MKKQRIKIFLKLLLGLFFCTLSQLMTNRMNSLSSTAGLTDYIYVGVPGVAAIYCFINMYFSYKKYIKETGTK